MTLTPLQREQVRLSILRYCGASGKYGMTTVLLLVSIRNEGLRGLSQEQLDSELQYLVDKGLLAKCDKKVSPENEAHRVTADGRDYLAQLNIDVPNE